MTLKEVVEIKRKQFIEEEAQLAEVISSWTDEVVQKFKDELKDVVPGVGTKLYPQDKLEVQGYVDGRLIQFEISLSLTYEQAIGRAATFIAAHKPFQSVYETRGVLSLEDLKE